MLWGRAVPTPIGGLMLLFQSVTILDPFILSLGSEWYLENKLEKNLGLALHPQKILIGCLNRTAALLVPWEVSQGGKIGNKIHGGHDAITGLVKAFDA